MARKPVGWRGERERHSDAAKRGKKSAVKAARGAETMLISLREASTEDLKELLGEAEEAQKLILNLPPAGLVMYPGSAGKDFGRMLRIQSMAEEELVRRKEFISRRTAKVSA